MKTNYYKSYVVDKAIILFFILWGIATIFKVAAAEPKLELIVDREGALQGVYFFLTDIRPYVMYILECSTDLTDWSEVVQLGTYQTGTYNEQASASMISPLWEWESLPKEKCFFRLREVW
jgi:hypothetical protein|tara:strand:- start:24 stop:383 length:360 start_codon:yes stop_codon:yes gene_type:complete